MRLYGCAAAGHGVAVQLQPISRRRIQCGTLADFEFYTKFGEAFQYSNQMVATAGYIAGRRQKVTTAILPATMPRRCRTVCWANRHDFDDAVIPAGRRGARQLCDSAHGAAGSPTAVSLWTSNGSFAVDRAGRCPLVDPQRHGALYDHAAFADGVAPDGHVSSRPRTSTSHASRRSPSMPTPATAWAG